MLKTLLLILLLSILQSCSQSKVTSASLKVTGGFTITSSSGGLLVYLHNKTTGITKTANSASTTFEAELDRGVWDFTLIAWDGGTPMAGTLHCGLAESVNVEGAELTVNITLNAGNCDNDRFSPSNHRTAGSTNVLKFYSCSTFTPVSGFSSHCNGSGGADQGFTGSYRIRFLTSTGDLSSCIAATIPTSDTTTTTELLSVVLSKNFLPSLKVLLTQTVPMKMKKNLFYFLMDLPKRQIQLRMQILEFMKLVI